MVAKIILYLTDVTINTYIAKYLNSNIIELYNITDKKNKFINENNNEIDENNKIKNDQYYKVN